MADQFVAAQFVAFNSSRSFRRRSIRRIINSSQSIRRIRKREKNSNLIRLLCFSLRQINFDSNIRQWICDYSFNDETYYEGNINCIVNEEKQMAFGPNPLDVTAGFHTDFELTLRGEIVCPGILEPHLFLPQ